MNKKLYIREGRRFVALPINTEDQIKKIFLNGYVGKWVDADTNKLSVEKPSSPLGLCVDIITDEKESQLVLITDIVGPTDFKAVKDLCKTDIRQLTSWKNEITTFTKDLIKKYGWIRIWSTTLWKATLFYSQPLELSALYTLYIDSNDCYMLGDDVDNDCHLFALKTETFPISKLSK